MHLIKLCVGIDSVEQLAAWQAMRLEKQRQAGVTPELVHRTRQMPKRREAVLKSGSLYWVIKGSVRARQRILDLREETDSRAGRSRAGGISIPKMSPLTSAQPGAWLRTIFQRRCAPSLPSWR
jgi:hypothetical protein